MSNNPNDLLLEDESPVSTGARKQPDSEIDITPMIVIVFLLLIFFVVTSKMQPQQVTDLPKARHGKELRPNNGLRSMLSVAVATYRKITRKDGSAFSSDREEQAQQIEDYVKEGLEQRDEAGCDSR